MSSVIIGGDTSGSVTLSAPAVSGSSVLTLPVATDTLVGKNTIDTLANKTLVAPALGTPASGILSSCTGLNLTTAVTGTLPVGNGGTGVATITTGGLVVGAATSAVTSLNPATAGNSIIDSGTAWTSVAQNWSYRNLIINGEFKVAQRGTSIAMTTGEVYGLDQWTWNNNAGGVGRVTVTQSTTVPNATFANSMKIDVTTVDTSLAASEQYGVFTHVEGLRSNRIGFGAAAAQTVTVSFWIRVDSTDLTFPATFGGSLLNSGFTRSYPFNFTVAASATWQKITVTIAGDVTGNWLKTTGQGLNLSLSFACGSTNAGPANTWAAAQYYSATGIANFMNHVNNDLYLTGVQIEVGSIATPFEYRSYGEELFLCQRYVYVFDGDTTTNKTLAIGTGRSATVADVIFRLPVPMRATPTLTVTANQYNVGDGSANVILTALVIASGNTSEEIVWLAATVAAGLTQFRPYFLGSEASGGKAIFSAEL